jgi:hypothetical protein
VAGVRGWALLGVLCCLPALAGCIGEAASAKAVDGFKARYERVGQDGEPVWGSGYEVELGSTMAKDREGTARPAYRVTVRSLEDTYGGGFSSSEALDGRWLVVRHEQQTFEGSKYDSDPNLWIRWADGSQASSTGVGWLQTLAGLPSVPVGDASVDVFRGKDETQVRVHHPRTDPAWGSSHRLSTYHYKPGALLPERIVESDYSGVGSEYRLTRFEATDRLAPVSPWPTPPAQSFPPAPRPGLIEDAQDDPLHLGYPIQEVLDAVQDEDGEAQYFLSHGCLYDYAIHFDAGWEADSETIPLLFTRTYSDLHEVGLGDRADGSARWVAQRFEDHAPGGASGFAVERSGIPMDRTPCMATVTMPVPEMGLGGFMDRLAAMRHGQLRSLRASIQDPQDPMRPVSTGWTSFEADFQDAPEGSALRLRMDAHQAWWTEALVRGADPEAFDTP